MQTQTKTAFVLKDEKLDMFYPVEAHDAEHAIKVAQEVYPNAEIEPETSKVFDIDETLELLQDEHHAQWCDEYGEPGYDQPRTGIVFADWHAIDQDIQDALKEAGYDLEWPDEWYADFSRSPCKAWRTIPTHHGWQCSLLYADGGFVTPDDGHAAAIEVCVLTDYRQPIQAVPYWVTASDLEAEGFRRVNDAPYEIGYRTGQNDVPKTIARDLFENQNATEVVFQVLEESMFYTCFSVWIKEGDTT